MGPLGVLTPADEIERYRKAMEDYQRAEYKVSISLNFLNLSQNFILSLGVLVGTMILAYRVSVLHTATVSNFVVFISYLVQLTGPYAQRSGCIDVAGSISSAHSIASCSPT